MDYAVARRNMVDGQLRTSRVRDADLIRALDAVPRELFLPRAMRSFAYIDHDLSLGDGRWLIEPMVLAHLLDAALIKPTDRVLSIGDACGYASAVIAQLAKAVVALDCDGDWVQKAAGTMADLGIDNVDAVHGPLRRGHAAKAPYDVIVFCGGIGEIPAEITAQLGKGGRLVAVVDRAPGLGKLVRVTRDGDCFGQCETFDAWAPPLPDPAAKPSFSF